MLYLKAKMKILIWKKNEILAIDLDLSVTCLFRYFKSSYIVVLMTSICFRINTLRIISKY